MKVIVLSMTVGQGHNSAGKAVASYLIDHGHEVQVIDTYKFLNKLIGEAMDKGYTFMGRSLPKLNEMIYEQAEKVNGRADMKIYFPFAFTDLYKPKMRRFLDEEDPDVIICTHIFCAILMTQLKEANMLKKYLPLYGILTDYTLHPFWEYTAMDYFVVANELLIPSVCRRGIPKEKILPFGIPVRKEFAVTHDQQAMRKKLGLDPDKLVCLLSSGGRGFGAMDKLLLQADQLENIQFVAVCGTNVFLKRKLDRMTFKNDVRVCGFVTNMDEYIDAADYLVAKPGGLSTQEALAKRKTLILTPPLPGVEDMNLMFLVNNSLAVHTNKYMPLNEVIMQLRMNKQKVASMHEACERWGRPYSSKTLGDFIIKNFEESR